MAEAAGDDDGGGDDDDDPANTPLIAACKKGHLDVARLLIDEGADVDLARVGHLLSTSGSNLNLGIRTWLRSETGRAFWLRVMSHDMGAS